MTTVYVRGRGARGETFADIARRTGVFGAVPASTDAQVLNLFAAYAITQNPGFQGAAGPSGTLVNNTGFTAGGPSIVQGDSATIFRILRADNAPMLGVHDAAPFVSVAGTRSTAAPRIVGGNGTDANFDSFITSNCVASGSALYRDEFQDMSTFSSSGGDGAHASFDAFCTFTGSTALNHQVDFQARGRTSMTGAGLGPSLAERTGYTFAPIFNGTFQCSELRGLWIRNAQKDSGTQTIYAAYGIYIDDLTNWGGPGGPFAVYVAANKSYFGGNIQCSPTATDIYNARQVLGKALHATGGVASFNPGGGVLIAGQGAADPGSIQAYSDGAGTAKPLALNLGGGDVLVGASLTVASKKFEVTGDILATADFYRGSTKVLGAQGAAVADAVAAAAAPTQAEFNALVTQFNTLLARLRAHGLIAT